MRHKLSATSPRPRIHSEIDNGRLAIAEAAQHRQAHRRFCTAAANPAGHQLAAAPDQRLGTWPGGSRAFGLHHGGQGIGLPAATQRHHPIEKVELSGLIAMHHRALRFMWAADPGGRRPMIGLR